MSLKLYSVIKGIFSITTASLSVYEDPLSERLDDRFHCLKELYRDTLEVDMSKDKSKYINRKSIDKYT